MVPDTRSEVEAQRRYYADTAPQYDEMHLHQKDEHFFALSFMISILDYYDIRSVLDVGSGTGRAVLYLKNRCPEMRIVGVEPVKDLREVGYEKGISRQELVEGDALALPYMDGEFDLVCEFGMLHHIRSPQLAVAEMLRVARKAVFISDSNRFGQGSVVTRSVKQLLGSLGLWKIADIVKTKGKGHSFSPGDGISYSYSVFDNYKQIRRNCSRVHLLNTRDGGTNPYRTASHVVLLGVKK